MKELLGKLFGATTDVVEAAEGEARDALETLTRTGRYVKYWAVGSMLFLAVGMGLCWSGGTDVAVRATMFASTVFSGIALAGIIWNATFVAGMIALATTAGDELFGARFPDVKPSTVISIARQAVGLVAWVAFVHLVALLLPVSAWRNPELSIAALVAISIIIAGAVAGWFSGPWGRRIMLTTAMAVVLLFVGRSIPGVREYASAMSADTTRTLVRMAAEKELGSIPDDLLIRKMGELATLRKAAVVRCGSYACSVQEEAAMALLEADIAELSGGMTAPGEIDETGSSDAADHASYGDHDLPPLQ